MIIYIYLYIYICVFIYMHLCINAFFPPPQHLRGTQPTFANQLPRQLPTAAE